MLYKEESRVRNKWLKKGMLVLTIGCLAFSMTGCKGEEVLNTVLEKVNLKEEETKTTEKKETEPEVPVEKPELTVNINGSVTYKTGAKAEPLKVEAAASDGGAITYQWYKSLTNTNGGGTVIDGETQNTFTPPTKEEGTVYYYVVATNTIKSSTNRITSDTMEVIVSNNPEEQAAEGEEENKGESKDENKEDNKEEENKSDSNKDAQ